MNETEKKEVPSPPVARPRAPFRVRDMLLFPYAEIMPGTRHAIVIKPKPEKPEARIERIVFHRSIALKLMLESVFHGQQQLARGAGSCEVFLAENIPNWTPEGIVITPASPLVLNVVNPAAFGAGAPESRALKVMGNCIVLYRAELEPEKS